MASKTTNKETKKICKYENKCMKYGCKLFHDKKIMIDCKEGNLCYNVNCFYLHSRNRNKRLFGKDFCYFGSNCILGTSERASRSSGLHFRSGASRSVPYQSSQEPGAYYL